VRYIYIDNMFRYGGLLSNLILSSLPYNAVRFTSTEFEQALAGMLRESDYDVVQLEGLYLAPYIKVIRENSGARIVYRAHNVEHLIWQKHSARVKNIFYKWYLRKMYHRIRSFEQQFINLYDLLLTVTRDDLEMLNSMGNLKPAFVAPFGMYEGKPDQGTHSGNGSFCLLYIGALDWMPNIEALDWFVEKVWPTVRDRHPSLKFLVAGRNAGERYVRYLNTRGVDYLGEVDSAGEFFSNRGIVVVPLFSSSGIRVRIIEAMNAGKPVVASSAALAGIPAESGKHILLADDETAFAECIDKLLVDKEYAIELGRKAREFSRIYFDNRIIAEEIMTFYKRYIQ
jgi:polysaccharide biosynthesis protein PslH